MKYMSATCNLILVKDKKEKTPASWRRPYSLLVLLSVEKFTKDWYPSNIFYRARRQVGCEPVATLIVVQIVSFAGWLFFQIFF